MQSRRFRHTRASFAPAAGLVVALALTGCRGGADAVPSPTPSPSPSPSPTPSPTPTFGPPSPLNGAPTDPDADLERRAVAVKIDNHQRARPQVGIDRADAVTELLVEGGLTRFLAIFHSRDAAEAGPVRSARPTDGTIVAPLGAPMAMSGGQAWIQSIIRGYGVHLIGHEASTMYRATGRPAPHNLMTSTDRLRAKADSRGLSDDPPPAWWSFGDLPSEAEPATEITLTWSPQSTARWTFDGERYRRTSDGAIHEILTEEGDRVQLSAETLVVVFANQYTARPPSGGSAVPASETVGSGRALVFAGGKVAEGTWSRAGVGDIFELSTQDGSDLHVPPGFLWLSVFPNGRNLSWSAP